ncbi:MAG: LysR family transcriptional regulator, partial [Oscillospiraceae bacterium]
TRVIHQIESEVDCELFSKNGRRIKLNSNGEVFYKYAKKVLADMEILFSEMDYILERREQTITLISNTESFSTQLINDFNRNSPDYSLSILQVRTNEMLDALVNGDAQFALSCPPLPVDGISDVIETINVFGAVGCLLFPSGHPLLNKKSISVDDLREEKLITMPKGSGMRNRLQPIFDVNNFHPRIICESDNLNVITQAVQSGVGYAFVTEVIMMDYPELWGNVRKVDIPDVVGYYGLSYNKHTVAGPNAANFKKFIVNFFNELSEKAIKTRPEFLE